MKTIKLLALLAVLVVAGLANAQTLTRSLVLKPAGETNTLTFGSSTPIGTSYSINLPGGGNAAGGPIVKTTTGAGTKNWSFGQINLASNTAISGDVTGILGVENGGTGLSAVASGEMLVGNGGNSLSTITAGVDGQVLGNVGGTPTWGYGLGTDNGVTVDINTGDNTTTNINTDGTGGTVNIGNATSTTTLYGDVVFDNMPDIPLTMNYMYVGNASNYASELTTVADRVLTSPGGVPTWSTTLPTGVTVPFDQISSGTNTTATMTVGTGASLVPSGTGIITATRFTGTGSTSNAVDLATAEVDGTLPINRGGTNSTTIGIAGTVSYSTGTAYASTAQGTSGQVLQSNGAGAPTWVNVGSLLANASFTLTAVAADVTAGYFTVDVTSVPTLITGYGYDALSRVIVTIESASGPGQVVSVTDRTASDFRIYTGAIALGDKVNVVIIDTTP